MSDLSWLMLIGAALGVALLLWWWRGRLGQRAQELLQVQQTLTAAQLELATLRERARGLEAQGAATLAEHEQTGIRAAQWRDALDSARDERAQLAERAARVPELESQLQAANDRLALGAQGLAQAQAQVAALRAENAGLRPQADRLEPAQLEAARLRQQLTELETRLDAEQAQTGQKLALLTEAREALSNQFKSLASDILEEKSKRFAEQNQASLGQLLDPLKLRLQEFQGRVELFYDTEGKQRSALAQQVAQLMRLNQTLSDDARNLTLALKGSAKSQGNWGELILERVLEASGLRKGHEYEVQESHTRDDGSRAQPDVVIHLPENRHLVVDAKVSLVAYDEMVNGANEVRRNAAQRRHLDSIRAHIKGLAERNYQVLYGVESLDFVLMFVPIEPAFMVAVQGDSELFMDAWNKNVLLVSPSTLLFVVRTVAHLWRQEAQSRNAQEIARRGAELYDRLAGFVADLERVGKNLAQAQDAYHDAFNKLSRNKGNVIRQAEMLRDLGIKPSKALSTALVEAAGDGGS